MSSLPNQVPVEEFTVLPSLNRGSSGATVLITDGDEHYRQLYSDLLRSEGFQTFDAKDCDQASAILHRERIDLALVDMVMPNTNGMTLCRELKNNPETRLVPILLLTDWKSDQNSVMEIENGADAYLNKPVNDIELITRVRALLDKKRFTDGLGNTEKVLLTLLEIVEAKNPYTAGHGQRVSQTAVSLAIQIGLSSAERECVRRGAYLHDIGEVGIPDEILMKLGPLTTEEKIVLNSHTYLGERICASLSLLHPILQIIRSHHERLDGSGYPDGLGGNQISILTRVVSLADVYDSLTTRQPYRGRFSHMQAMHQIRREAEQGWWDLTVFDALGRLGNPESLP
ncbi:MAG: HD domain-containing phosphohydrolase [Candidatus Korobacteraceae bacterium]|jgi:putative two-component system response regulator